MQLISHCATLLLSRLTVALEGHREEIIRSINYI
jgi:hypothetical protein